MNIKRRFPVTDDTLDAPDGVIVNGYEREGDYWMPHGCLIEDCIMTLTMTIGAGQEICWLHAIELGIPFRGRDVCG